MGNLCVEGTNDAELLIIRFRGDADMTKPLILHIFIPYAVGYYALPERNHGLYSKFPEEEPHHNNCVAQHLPNTRHTCVKLAPPRSDLT